MHDATHAVGVVQDIIGEPANRNRLARYVEPTLTVGSAIAAEPINILSGLLQSGESGQDLLELFGFEPYEESPRPSQSLGRMIEVGDKLTYSPRTPEGQAGLQSLKDAWVSVMDTLGVDEAINYLNTTIVPNLQKAFGEEAAKEIGSAVLASVPMIRRVPSLPMDKASRMQRLQEQGYDLNNPYFHASKQDIDEMKPGYDDGLVFVTPDSEFANHWLGKGKFQERQGGTGSIEQLKKQKTILRAEHDEVMKSLSEADGQRYYDEVAWPQTRQLMTEINQADSAIYPLLSKTKKPFRPDQDYEVLEELYGKEHLDSPFSSEFKTYRDAMKDGNYILYENKEVVNFLKSKGYDSMFLKESHGSGNKFTTLAVFDSKDLRSTNAQFDPNKTDSRNILASGAPVAAALLGAGALSPEEAEAGPSTKKTIRFNAP